MNTKFDEQYELMFRLGDFSSDGAKLFIEYSDEQGLTIKIDFLSVSFAVHRRKILEDTFTDVILTCLSDSGMVSFYLKECWKEKLCRKTIGERLSSLEVLVAQNW